MTYYRKTSNYQFNNGKAQFRLYFTHDKNIISDYYRMFSNELTIDGFIIGKFKIKENKREFVGGKGQSGFLSYNTHVKSKAEEAKDVKVSVNQISDNVYDMTVTGGSGEYLLTWDEKMVHHKPYLILP